MTHFQSASRSIRQSNTWSAIVGAVIFGGAIATWTSGVGHAVAAGLGVGMFCSAIGGLMARRTLTRAHEIDRRHG